MTTPVPGLRSRRCVFALSFLLFGTLQAASAQQQTPYNQPEAILASGPEEGTRAPDFSLPWADRDSVGPGDQWFGLGLHRGQPVVLVFYPRDFTPTTTTQLTRFTQDFADLFGDQAIVVGISPDSLETHHRYAASLGLPFRLLSDLDQKVSKTYGSVDQPGYNRRTVYVIDRKGKVAYRDLQFSAGKSKAYESLKAAVRSASRP